MFSPILHDLLQILVGNSTCGSGSSVVKRNILVGMEILLEEFYWLWSLRGTVLTLIHLQAIESIFLLGVESSV